MLNLALVGIFLIGAGVSLFRLAGGAGPNSEAAANAYLDSREADATHLLMNATMALMLTAFYAGIAAFIVLLLYWLAAAALAWRLFTSLRSTNPQTAAARNARIGGSIYHLLMVAAMLYGLQLMPASMALSMAAMCGKAMPAFAPAWPVLILGLVFLLDAITSLIATMLFPQSLQRAEANLLGNATTRETSIHSLRVSLIPHLIMDLGMAYMLLTS